MGKERGRKNGIRRQRGSSEEERGNETQREEQNTDKLSERKN